MVLHLANVPVLRAFLLMHKGLNFSIINVKGVGALSES